MKNKNYPDVEQAIELLGEAMRVLGPAHFSLREDIGWVVDEARGLLGGEEDADADGSEDFGGIGDFDATDY
ncbi:MAG: hypothetical protein IJV00_00240 [Clostridia bacterium]|nr:hypothetical protein [Clostridia bacterium]